MPETTKKFPHFSNARISWYGGDGLRNETMPVFRTITIKVYELNHVDNEKLMAMSFVSY